MGVRSLAGSIKNLAGTLLRAAILKAIARPVRRIVRRFEIATTQPQWHQETIFRRILAYHRATDFARDHHFDDMRDTAQFRRNVPVTTYDYFEPYLARVRRGDFRALLADRRVYMFALTSGTTGARKSIPVTQQYLDDYRRGWMQWALRANREHPEIRLRPIVQLSDSSDEFRTEAGIPCGSVSGLTASMQNFLVRSIYCVPVCVGKIKDSASRAYVALRLSIPCQVGMVLTANPSTLIMLARSGNQEKEALIRDLYDGTLHAKCLLPDDVRAKLRRRFAKRHRERASELESMVNRTGTLYPKDYWPTACLLGTWTGGSMAAYLHQFPRYFGQTPIRDIGLIASEGRMTIPVRDGTPGGVLDITSHYFEFIPEAEIDSPRASVLAAHELEEGGKYFILLTTAFGLYRYNIYDLVRVTGFFNRTPIIEFLNKGAHFANMTGEKISEYQVTHAMSEALSEFDLSLTAYSLAPCWDDVQPYYGLFVERSDFLTTDHALRLAEQVDCGLRQQNIEYASKRGSRRLGPVRMELMAPGTWGEWDHRQLMRTGGPEAQYKHPCLITDPHFREKVSVEQPLYRHRVLVF